MTTIVDTKLLRANAQAATPGPWEAVAKPDPDPCEGTHYLMCKQGALGYWRGHKRHHDDSNWILNEADARHIAGLNPVVVLALLDRLDAAESGVALSICPTEKEGKEMSPYKARALKEFRAAGWTDESGKFKCEMQEAICNHVLALLDVFDGEGHSGSSAPYAIKLFSKLAAFEPVAPLTGEDWEWNEVRPGVFQNNRCGRVFKDASRFDGKPYDIDAVVFWEWETDSKTGEKFKSYFTNRDSARVIEFPYTPERKYEEKV